MLCVNCKLGRLVKARRSNVLFLGIAFADFAWKLLQQRALIALLCDKKNQFENHSLDEVKKL